MIRKEIFDVIHKTIYQFIDGEDNEEVPMSDKDKLLLEVNKAICNNLKALEQEPILDKVRKEIKELDDKVCQQFLIEDVDKEVHHAYQDCLNIIDKYRTEGEK